MDELLGSGKSRVAGSTGTIAQRNGPLIWPLDIYIQRLFIQDFTGTIDIHAAGPVFSFGRLAGYNYGYSSSK